MKDWLRHLVLKGKEIEKQIQGVNAEKTFTLQHIKNCEMLELEEKEESHAERCKNVS